MQKILAKEFGRGNICLSIKFWGILTTHEFDNGEYQIIFIDFTQSLSFSMQG